ncbi:MAG TPA: hypothetical protein VES67_10100 [Vicinamibacterales bacterium]|nr:hypothetical protein [Vicinamibacterales bacterium]
MIHLLWLAAAALIIWWKYGHHALRADDLGTVSPQWLHEYRREAHTNS